MKNTKKELNSASPFGKFITSIETLGIIVGKDPRKYNVNPQKHDNEFFIFVEWSSGGWSGGSCWNNDPALPYVTNNLPIEFVAIDMILEHFCPDMNFLSYKKLCLEVVEYGSRTEYEYYGNSTDYQIKICDLKKLYKYLLNENIIL